MNISFTSFIKPFLNIIDSGELFRKPFSWLYYLLAGLNLLVPVALLFKLGDVFDMPFKFAITFILTWFVVAAAGWIGFQIWWDRKEMVTKTSAVGDEFIATPVFAHFVQTFGEWLAAWVTVVGLGFALFSSIFLGDSASQLARMMGIPLASGFVFILLYPIIGFAIIVVFRFLAETFRAIASIANNTRSNTSTLNS